MLKVANSVISASRITGVLPVANGGTNASTASITSFNNITGFTASGTTGTTSTNLVFATTPTLVGDVTLSTGNLVIGTAGKGIDFSVTSSGSGTMTSELLSDYEEGTWTPSLGGTATYSVQSGNYTKIGRLVNIRCNIEVLLILTGSTSQISGLPFTTATTTTGNPPASGVVGYFGSLAVSPVYISTIAVSGGTTINVSGLTAAGATASAGLGVFGNSARIDFTMTYFVN